MVKRWGRKLAQLSAEERAAMVERYAAGERVELIARDFGVSHPQVCNVARAAGVPPRRKVRFIDAAAQELASREAEAPEDLAALADLAPPYLGAPGWDQPEASPELPGLQPAGDLAAVLAEVRLLRRELESMRRDTVGKLATLDMSLRRLHARRRRSDDEPQMGLSLAPYA